MKQFLMAFLLLVCLLHVPFVGKGQSEFSIKARGTGFYGPYGKSYASIGYEPAFTVQPGKFWAGGISYSHNLLALDAHSSAMDLSGEMHLINGHIGAKKTLARYFHPFIYAMAGFRFAEYSSSALPEESNPALNSITVGYGLKTGLQIGKGEWRFEASVELLSGTKAKYLTPLSFEQGYTNGGRYRDFANRSNMTGVTASIGIVYVFDLENVLADAQL